jgi:transposase
MLNTFTLTKFNKLFPTEDACFKEITKKRFPSGIVCQVCERITKHYKLRERPVLTCKFCRNQTSPLIGTLFEKSTTPLKTWFLALYLMTQTRGNMPTRILKEELGVTYKTAWRVRNNIYKLMQLNKGNLLTDTQISKWVIFNTIELKVVRKT